MMSAGRVVRRKGAWLLAGALLMTLTPTARAQEEEPRGGLNLEACLALGLARQPALHAAQASLSGAMSGQEGLNNLPKLAGLFSRDLPIRRNQACLGVGIQSAQLKQIEWDTRYAITRNYFSVVYARMQLDLVQSVAKNLEEARDDAKRLVEKGGGVIILTNLDVDSLSVNLELVKVKQAEAETGVLRAIAALREAMGIGPEYPLEVVGAPLPALFGDLNKEQLINSALANRGEIAMASAASEVVGLEIEAQRRLLFKLQTKTFAYGADIHAKPIPTGISNHEYRPEALGLEMPVGFVGKRHDRMARASAYHDRSMAVLDKTQNLVALEVEVIYLKWLEAGQKVGNLERALKLARPLAADVRKRFNEGNTTGETYLRTRGMVDQTQALLNEAFYNHALALAGLERATAGGFLLPCPAVTKAEEK